jgi:hypothetical protein
MMVFGAGIYATYSKRNKIFCDYEGEDGTYEYKWIKDVDGWVIFRGYKHKIMPERMSTVWVKTGIHYLFPTRAMHLSFAWYSAWPRDPKNFGRTVISPKVRKVIDKSALVESYFKTSTPSSSKKEGGISKYLPIILVVVVVILAFWMYSNMQSLAGGLNHLQQQINTLVPK